MKLDDTLTTLIDALSLARQHVTRAANLVDDAHDNVRDAETLHRKLIDIERTAHARLIGEIDRQGEF